MTLPPTPAVKPLPSRPAIFAAAAVLTLAALAAYHNTFQAPFVFDDIASILDNPTLPNPWEALRRQPVDFGVTVAGRPIVNFSLALSHALSGTGVWGYHAINLLIHVAAGLTLFGVVRRTLMRSQIREHLADEGNTVGRSLATDDRPRAGFLHDDATFIALVIALLWTLHPLQTEAVTYVIQRTESLVGLCYLLTFYCFIRSIDSSRAWLWWVLAVGTCLLGMGTKEVMVTAPVLVLLYDRTLLSSRVAGTSREAWRQRRWLHLGLMATWLPLMLLVAGTGWNRGGTAGLDVGVAPWAYWLTQCKAVIWYLRLSVWPHPLVFEYGTFWLSPAQALPYALIVAPLAAATLYALWRWPVAGFLGAWFFVILAPTSVVPGTLQMIVEHRMYLPLAAVLALVVGVVASRFGRPGLVVCLALAPVLGLLTERRNAVYRDDLVLWQDTVKKAPGSATAQANLGKALCARDRIPEAIPHYEEAVRLNPRLPIALYNLGLALARTDRPGEALANYAEALRINPRLYQAHYQMGVALLQLSRPQEALEHFATTAQANPHMEAAHNQWGLALAKLGQVAEAIPHYQMALRLAPDYAEAECNLGVALFQMNRVPEALECFQQALRHNPKLPEAHFNLGLILGQLGRPDEARSHYAEAVRLDPAHADARLNLGIMLAQAGKLPEALEHLEQAARLKPDLPETHGNLGIALAEAGRLEDAVRHYATALKLKPDYAEAHYNLGNALLGLRRLPEARYHFAEAVRINPGFDAARDMLSRLQTLPE